MTLDAFTWLVILLPLGVYWFIVGLMIISRRPTIVTGVRDTFAFGLSFVGLALAGPLSLFFPQTAFNLFGGWVWLVLLVLYVLMLVLVSLASRPKLVVYSANSESFFQLLNEVFVALDSNVRWAGASFFMPELKIDGNVEFSALDRTVQIVATSREQDLENWNVLRKALAIKLNDQAKHNFAPNRSLLFGATLLLIGIGLIIKQPVEMLAAMKEALRF
jgi:hypothetical protein